MVYIIACILSSAMGSIAGMREEGLPRIFFCIAAILPYCFLAAVRAYTVGTDVLVYVYPVFTSAASLSMTEIISSYSNVEPGFSFLSWIISLVTGNNMQVMLFVLELLIIAPIAYVVSRSVPQEMGTALVVYGFLLFGFGLCVIRQSITASFLLLAGLFAWEKKPIKYLIALLIAISFHIVGAIGLLIWPFVGLFMNSSSQISGRKLGHIAVIIICTAAASLCAIFIFSSDFIELAGRIKYTFASQSNYSEGSGFTVSFMVYALVAVAGYCLVFHGRKFSISLIADNSIKLLLLVIVLSAVMAQLSLLSTQLNRIGWLLLTAACLYWSLILAQIKRGHFEAFLILATVHALFFVWIYVNGNVGEIYPYSSTIIPLMNL